MTNLITSHDDNFLLDDDMILFGELDSLETIQSGSQKKKENINNPEDNLLLFWSRQWQYDGVIP